MGVVFKSNKLRKRSVYKLTIKITGKFCSSTVINLFQPCDKKIKT